MVLRRISLVAVTILALSLATVGIATAQDPNPNCSLKVPNNPLTAQGLTTPYELSATDPAAGACDEANDAQSAFVEAAIFNPADRSIQLYRPVVVNQGDQPGAAPVPVTLPAGAVVGIWFGYQGDNLTLTGGNRGCVNGFRNSVFGQFAYCNAPVFFAAALRGGVRPPALGTGRDGLPCPTTRDFAVVDQDQSDNVLTQYKIVNGKIAQATAPNQADGTIKNASDNGLLNRNILPALGCQSFTLPDITTGGSREPSLAANEISATLQRDPAALIPLNNPMTQVDGRFSVPKTGLYRLGVNQPLRDGQTPAQYCTLMQQIANERIARDNALFTNAPSPDPALNLKDFLVQRLQTSVQELNCNNQGRDDNRGPFHKRGERVLR